MSEAVLEAYRMGKIEWYSKSEEIRGFNKDGIEITGSIGLFLSA
ncbi:hypothetical protein [Lachnoclostridium sp.]|nr:hypothetical protein [Lachnoclostridium sp.]